MFSFLRIALFVIVLLAILYAGLRPQPIPQDFDRQDLLYHALAFAALVCSARLAFPATHVFWTVLYSLLLGVIIELTQGLMPLRTPSVADMAANIAGVVVGLVIALQLKRLYLHRLARSGE